MPAGDVLCEPGGKFSYAYFPTTAILSMVYDTESGQTSEIAVIGNESFIGVSLFMGGDSMTNRFVVRNAGLSYPATCAITQVRVQP